MRNPSLIFPFVPTPRINNQSAISSLPVYLLMNNFQPVTQYIRLVHHLEFTSFSIRPQK